MLLPCTCYDVASLPCVCHTVALLLNRWCGSVGRNDAAHLRPLAPLLYESTSLASRANALSLDARCVCLDARHRLKRSLTPTHMPASSQGHRKPRASALQRHAEALCRQALLIWTALCTTGSLGGGLAQEILLPRFPIQSGSGTRENGIPTSMAPWNLQNCPYYDIPPIYV